MSCNIAKIIFSAFYTHYIFSDKQIRAELMSVSNDILNIWQLNFQNWYKGQIGTLYVHIMSRTKPWMIYLYVVIVTWDLDGMQLVQQAQSFLCAWTIVWICFKMLRDISRSFVGLTFAGLDIMLPLLSQS